MGEFHNAEQLVEFDSEGRLHADDHVLSQVKNQRFLLHIEGDTVTLTATPADPQPATPQLRRLSEIEDTQERLAALDVLLDLVSHPGPAQLPDGWDSRESIYD